MEVDWNTGVPIDSLEIDSRITTLIAAEGLLYSYSYGGDFSLLQHDETGFKTISTFRVEGGIKKQHCSHPVIKDGRLYVRHDNSLFVYNIAKFHYLSPYCSGNRNCHRLQSCGLSPCLFH